MGDVRCFAFFVFFLINIFINIFMLLLLLFWGRFWSLVNDGIVVGRGHGGVRYYWVIVWRL